MNSVLFFGKPNSGKTLLFNRMTGLRQKVANFPGVTVEIKTGQGPDGDFFADYPGVYSFEPLTEDERVAVEKFDQALIGNTVAVVVGVLDATRLERSLSLGLQAKERAERAGKAFVFALNMMDEIKISGSSIDVEGLSKALDTPVVGISARTGEGLGQLKEMIAQEKKDWLAQGSQSIVRVGEAPIKASELAHELAKRFGPDSAVILKSQNRLDRIFLSNILGGVLFLAIMAFLFQAIFTWATPLMDLTESIISGTGAYLASMLPEGAFSDFINDALFGGIGSFLVFVPQIFVLTFIIGILEDSGYLARAAIICHRPLSYFGLSGKSFIPLLSGHACAIPAIYAARTMESPRKRWLTIMAVPLMSCSARLPVYTLLIASLIPSATVAFGLIGLQGLTLFLLYLFGIVVGLIVTGVISRIGSRSKKNSEPFLLELPPYRWPHWKPLTLRSLSASYNFATKAGPVIFVVTVVVWVLGYFPGGAGQLDESYLAIFGRAIEPIFETIGLDWVMGVAILTSFLAREVFVGTLGTLLGIEGAEENVADLSANLQASGMTFASGMALLVFYAVALQCVSTLAVIKREAGNWKFPTLLFIGYTILAFVLAFITYHIF